MNHKGARANSNLAMLEFVARKLGKLNDEIVFLGGCATAFDKKLGKQNIISRQCKK